MFDSYQEKKEKKKSKEEKYFEIHENTSSRQSHEVLMDPSEESSNKEWIQNKDKFFEYNPPNPQLFFHEPIQTPWDS